MVQKKRLHRSEGQNTIVSSRKPQLTRGIEGDSLSLISFVKTTFQNALAQATNHGTPRQRGADSATQAKASSHRPSASDMTHGLKVRGGEGGMRSGITKTQQKAYWQGFTEGKKSVDGNSAESK